MPVTPEIIAGMKLPALFKNIDCFPCFDLQCRSLGTPDYFNCAGQDDSAGATPPGLVDRVCDVMTRLTRVRCH